MRESYCHNIMIKIFFEAVLNICQMTLLELQNFNHQTFLIVQSFCGKRICVYSFNKQKLNLEHILSNNKTALQKNVS